MSEAQANKPKSGWLNVFVDYGPLLVFFLTYRYFAPDGEDVAGEIFAVIRSTGAFIAAAIVALGFSKWYLGRISPMLWLSTMFIVIFGGITFGPATSASSSASRLQSISSSACCCLLAGGRAGHC
jgi:intracellular septation protein